MCVKGKISFQISAYDGSKDSDFYRIYIHYAFFPYSIIIMYASQKYRDTCIMNLIAYTISIILLFLGWEWENEWVMFVMLCNLLERN